MNVPDGWKLVPIDPTEEMLVLGQEAWAYRKSLQNALEDCTEAEAAYRTMLATAPDPPNPAPKH